jgi:molybdopterin converting factor small subunit
VIAVPGPNGRLMDINVKVATVLARRAVPPLEQITFPLTLEQETDVTALVERLGIPLKLVGSVTINKKRSPLDTQLADGDDVAIIPAISGG